MYLIRFYNFYFIKFFWYPILNGRIKNTFLKRTNDTTFRPKCEITKTAAEISRDYVNIILI